MLSCCLKTNLALVALLEIKGENVVKEGGFNTLQMREILKRRGSVNGLFLLKVGDAIRCIQSFNVEVNVVILSMPDRITTKEHTDSDNGIETLHADGCSEVSRIPSYAWTDILYDSTSATYAVVTKFFEKKMSIDRIYVRAQVDLDQLSSELRGLALLSTTEVPS